MDVKKCGCCKKELPFDMYHKDTKTISGYACYCVDCVRTKNAVKHSKNKNNFEYNTSRQLNASKLRAKEKNLVHTLTLEELRSLYPPDMVCPVLGVKMTWGTPRSSSPSLDRIYPDLGYTLENCQIISNKANIMKNDATLEELEALVAYLKEVTLV